MLNRHRTITHRPFTDSRSLTNRLSFSRCKTRPTSVLHIHSVIGQVGIRMSVAGREQYVQSPLPRYEAQPRIESPGVRAREEQWSFELADEPLAEERHGIHKGSPVGRRPRRETPQRHCHRQRKHSHSPRNLGDADVRERLNEPGRRNRLDGPRSLTADRAWEQFDPDSFLGDADVPAWKDSAIFSLPDVSRGSRIDNLKPRLAPVCYISGETQSEICCRVARLDNEACESSGESWLDSRHYRERDRSGARDDPDLYARQLTPQPGCQRRQSQRR